ncbi:hypothetical protein VQ643_11910 [Pseudomonas sp. F1_0610]|uniref:hypothetical protein n=1 Tax=Pseudomonas sp. F1_0610 TaxID=3114284 RepID=UPI0039C4E2E4
MEFFIMKKTVLACALILAASNVLAADEEKSSIRDTVKSFTSSVTAAGKDALAGASEGIDEGRKSGTSVDGALIIYDKENLAKYSAIKVLSVEEVDSSTFAVTLAVKNTSDTVIRLTNLHQQSNLYMLDADDFVAYLDSPQTDVTLPAKTATKLRLKFVKAEGKPVVVRIYDYDVKVEVK